jgi:hypothetical protein
MASKKASEVSPVLSRIACASAGEVSGPRQGAAGGNGVPCRHLHHDRAGAAHLVMQQAHGVGLVVVGAERVGADQFGQPIGLVRLGAAHRAHLVQDHRHAKIGRRPGGFGAGHAAADDMDGANVVF